MKEILKMKSIGKLSLHVSYKETSANVSRMRHIHQQAAKSKPPWRICFFGTDEFSLKILEALSESMMVAANSGCIVQSLDVVHSKVKKMTQVKKYADVCGLNQFAWPLDTKLVKGRYDVGVLASFGHLIPKTLVEAFPYGIINVHPSLLPHWRGAAPLHHTILNGDRKSGVSIMAIQPKRFDVGPILDTKLIDLPQRPIFSTLRDSMAHEGGKLILKALNELPTTLSNARSQDNSFVTHAHKLTLQNSYINWECQTVDQIDRQYRAIFEMTELRTQFMGKTMRLMDMRAPSLQPLVELDEESPPGLPVYDKPNGVVHVRCKDGWVAFSNVSIKKKMSAKSFFNGYLSKEHLKGSCFKSVENNLFSDSYFKWIDNPRPS